jgi:TP901 family phage tail tape measure protein
MAASTSAYRILMEARINKAASEAGIKADISAIAKNQKMLIGVKIDIGDKGKLQEELNRITAAAGQLSQVKIFSNDAGQIGKAIVTYTDGLGKASSKVITINEGLKTTTVSTQNIAKETAAYNKLLLDSQKQTARQADEMGRIALNADKFMAKAAHLKDSPALRAGKSIAEQIKVAVADGDITQVRKLNDQLEIQKSHLTGLGHGMDSWGEGLKRNLKHIIEMTIAGGALFTVLNQLKLGVQYISDLNKEMTNIQIVTGFSAEQTAKLAMDYNTLGKELGATTIEVAKSSTEWFRQGKSIEETQTLIKSSMMMSKLANMDSAQATEYLTSIINGFKLEASETEDVISRLVALDNAFATSTSEIASAMQRSSVSAQQAGVSMEELASMIAVVSDVSRRAPESIGEAFKTMFARYQDILAGAVDEDGLGINNVAKSLARVGISIRDTSGGFRDFSSVLDELYGKWQGINEIEQANILKAMAGIRQRETLLVLLENETKYRDALTETQNAEGLAQQRYAIYLESVEAAQNRAKAAAEGMWQATINSGAIKFFYDISAGVLNLVTSLGGLQNVLTLVIAYMVTFNTLNVTTTIVTFISSIWSLVAGFGAFVAQAGLANTALGIFNTLLYTNPLGLVVGALALAVGAFNLFYESVDEATKKVTEISQAVDGFQSKISTLSEEKDQLRELYVEFDDLRNITNKSADEQQKFYDVQNKIKDILPQVNGYYDDQGNFILDAATNLQELIDLKNKELDIEKRKLALEARKGLKEEAELYEELAVQRQYYIDVLNHEIRGPGTASKDVAQERLDEIQLSIDESELRLRQFYNSLAEEDRKVFLEAAKGTEIYKLLTQAVEDFQDKAGDAELPAMEIPTSPEASQESQQALEDIRNMVVDMIKQKKKAEIDAIKDELDAFKDYIDKQKQLYKDLYDEEKRLREEKKIALDREMEDTRKLIDLQKDAAQDQLDDYKDLIDAQIDLLNEKKRAADYDKKRKSNQEELGKLESEIALLALDDSAEAIAQRMQLEEEASNLRGQMEEEAADETIRLQEEALNNEKKLAEEQAQLRIKELEEELRQAEQVHEIRTRDLEDEQRAAEEAYNIQIRRLEDEYAARESSLQAKIDQIQKYLDQEGTIVNDAMNMIVNKNSETYDALIEWNKVYGSGITSDVVGAWELALAAVEAYKLAMSDVAAPPSGGGSDFYGNDPLFNSPSPGNGYEYDPNENYTNPTGRHSGVDTGPVGGRFALKSNEEFAKLLSGEIVINSAQMDRFMTRTLPQIASTNNNGGNIEINMPIQCAGNLDRSVLPDIDAIVKKAVKQLNDNLSQRGFTRNASAFSTG